MSSRFSRPFRIAVVRDSDTMDVTDIATAASSDITLWSMFWQAAFAVKLVMIGLLGASVGLTLDATSNQFVADTSQTNSIGTIEGFVDGPPAAVGGPFLTGTRVAVQITSTVAY